MQVRKAVTLIAAAAVALAVVLSFRLSAPKPTVVIGLIGYQDWHNGPSFGGIRLDDGPSLVAFVRITNAGRIPIYHTPSFEDAVLKTEPPPGRAIREIESRMKFVVPLRAVLDPGSNSVSGFDLPPDTKRWQISLKVNTPSWKERVVLKLPKTWQRRLEPTLRRILPNKDGRLEIQSEVFEVPDNLRRPRRIGPPNIVEPSPFAPVV